MESSLKKFKGRSTTAIHSAETTGNNDAHITPIYASSTFSFESAEKGMERFAGEDKTRIYSRWGNPTCNAAEQTIEALEAFGLQDENGQPLRLKALLHSSGQSALTTLFMSTLKAGDMVLSQQSLYGGTHELFHKVLEGAGIGCIIADLRKTGEIESILKEHPAIKLIHIETPANPTMQCVDILVITEIAKKFKIKVSVDNTFASPLLQQPFKYGVDFVMHSTTKFLNGHGTAIGGVLLGKDLEFMKSVVWKWHILLGGNSNPFEAFLLLNGMKTLELRMERHCSNAEKVAEFLHLHPGVERVYYAGLKTHPDYATAKKQMTHPGAVLSFELIGGLDAGKKFINRLKVCVRAISLGTTDTLVSHPASMSHKGVSEAERQAFGITNGLIRMSVGIENIEDIMDDLKQALDFTV